MTEPQRRALSALLETVRSNIRTLGQRHPANGVLESQGVNTLGEVMDGDWYVNRHAARRMTLAELRRGPGHERPPDMTAAWRVLVVKPFGVNPGLLVADAKNDLYILRFDPRGSEGLATGAQMVSSQFFFALGYHVAENYIVRFDRPRLMADETGQAVSSAGRARALAVEDIDRFLKAVPEGPGRSYRAVATRFPEGRGALLGPYQMWGTRSDDPNDTVLHEHRRDLRGMFVFAAWLNFSHARAVTTQDIVTTVDGVPRIRHYIVDLTRSLGSGMFDGPKLAWEGNETVLPKPRRDRQGHREPRSGDAGMDAGEVPRSAGGRRVRQQHVRPGGVDLRRPPAAVRESPAGRHVLGRSAGRGIHRRRDPRDRATRAIQQAGRGLDHRHAHRATQPDRADVLRDACCRSTASACRATRSHSTTWASPTALPSRARTPITWHAFDNAKDTLLDDDWDRAGGAGQGASRSLPAPMWPRESTRARRR